MAKANKRSISFYPEHEKYIEQFPSKQRGTDNFSQKVQEIITDHYYMLLRTKKEVEGVFTEKEWNCIKDALNGSMLPANISYRTMLKAQIEDAVLLDKIDEKWGIDAEALVRKIGGLTEFQCYTISKMVDEFWNQDQTRRV
jgi:hypothetical protein